MLVGARANVSYATAEQVTPLGLAIESGNLAVVTLLLQSGASPTRVHGDNRQPPLTVAARGARPDILERIARTGVALDQGDTLGRSAAWHAAKANCSACIKVLAELGADLEQPDGQGVPPLVAAAADGDLASLEALLQAGANVGSTTREGNTALLVAAGSGREAALAILVQAGSDLDHRNALGNTALMEAVLGERQGNVRLLLESGADPGLRNRDRLTARAVAEQNRFESVLAEFERHEKSGKGLFGLLE